MRHVVYYVAITVDGYIAHEDSTIDGFPADGDHIAAYLESLPAWFDTVVMGRKTYEFGLQMGTTNPYPMLQQYVLSRTMSASPDEHVTLVSGDAAEFVRTLRQEPETGKAIYLCGGAELASTLLVAGLVDELIVKISPVLFGAGIPLFGGRISQTALTLTRTQVYESGVIFAHYTVS